VLRKVTLLSGGRKIVVLEGYQILPAHRCDKNSENEDDGMVKNSGLTVTILPVLFLTGDPGFDWSCYLYLWQIFYVVSSSLKLKTNLFQCYAQCAALDIRIQTKKTLSYPEERTLATCL
jgi:hypothetical protein